MSDDVRARKEAFDKEWGFRSETRSYGEKMQAEHWFTAGWRSALEAATSAPAVDREALAREMYAADFWGDENAHRDWGELIAHPVHFERYRARADALIASGILRDVRDVQAEALEQYADDRWGAVGKRRKEENSMFDEELRIRDRAQAIREARSER